MNNSFGKRSPIALSFYFFIAISPPTSQIGLGSVLGKICPLHFYGMGPFFNLVIWLMKFFLDSIAKRHEEK